MSTKKIILIALACIGLIIASFFGGRSPLVKPVRSMGVTTPANPYVITNTDILSGRVLSYDSEEDPYEINKCVKMYKLLSE